MSFICHIHNYTEYNEEWNVFSAFNPFRAVSSRHCGARGAVGGSVPCSRVSPQSWTFPARAGIRTHNLGLPRVSSPTLYPLGHDCPDNAWLHVARICTQFLEAENIPVLAWPAYSPGMSPIEHVWDALDRRIQQRVPVPDNIQQLCTAIEEEWTNIPQATVNNLINSMWRRCIALREANGGHTRYWLVFGHPRTQFPPPNTVKLHILEWPFIVASLRHTCAIIMLSNRHLDMPHLSGGWIISAKEKCSLTQI